jgi:hypothetical protein
MSLRLALAVLWVAACAPSAFDDLRNSVREDAGPEAERDSGAAGPDASAVEAGSGGAADKDSSAPGHAGSSSGGGGGAAAHSGGSAGRAGNSGGGGMSGAAGAGSGGVGGGGGMQPSAAGAAGIAAACGDTASDPHHCGSCDHACGNAASAEVSCVSSTCVTKCRAGFADCDGDLAAGPSGNGCETATATSLAHCGTCGNSCPQPTGALSACEASACVVYSSQVGAGTAVSSAPHGSVGGAAYDQTCPVGEVLVGLDVTTTGDIAYGLNVLCASFALEGTAGAPVFTTGTPHAPNVAIGGIIDPVPPSVRFVCPENTVVAGVAGVTYIWSDGTRMNPPSIRSISLACNELSLDPQRRLVFAPKKVLDIGDRLDALDAYSDQCPSSQVVVGFKGYAGAYIDALQTFCGAVSVNAAPAAN